MNVLNAQINRISIFILYSLVLAGCGGGSATSYSPSSASSPVTPGAPAPTISVTVGTSSIAYGASTTISWTSTNSTSCVSSGGGGTGTTGTFNTGALTSTKSYTVSCIGAGGPASKGATISVAPSVITGFVNTGGTGNITVTSANDLSSGMIVSITGTASYNGSYTVVSATSTNFVIARAWVNASEAQTGTWQLAGGMIAGCTSTGATGAITLSNAPSRFTGVAPLSVFFDASGTTATSTTRPFHNLEYRWDFDDAAGSPVNGTTWNAGSKAGVSSRNVATGPEAAHVFELPGTYTVALSATDGTNTASNSCAQIVVQDPNLVFAGNNTVCVGAASTPVAGVNGCPAGALTVMQSSFPTAVNTYALAGKRVLFQRGDTFAAATTATLNRTGPGILGAFGAAVAKPNIQMTGNTNILALSSKATPTIKDWRIMDLEFDGMDAASSIGIDAKGGINQVLMLNMKIHRTTIGLGLDGDLIQLHYLDGAGHSMWDEISVVDSTITPRTNNTGGLWKIYASANRFSIQGNTLGNVSDNRSMGSHVVRIPYTERAVIANNTIARPGINQVAIKLHSQAWCETGYPVGTCKAYDTGDVPYVQPPSTYNIVTNTHPIGIYSALSGYTEKVIISDNKIIGADNPYTISVAAQNPIRDERLRDIIVERNWFVAGAGTQLAMYVEATDTTIRNNIFNMIGGSKYKTFIYLTPPGYSPPVNNVSIYNNTLYGGTDPAVSGNEFVGIRIDSTANNVTAINNLISAPTATNPVGISGAGTGYVGSNNLLTAASPATIFVSAAPSIPADFNILSTSPALNTGLSSAPVWSDFFLTVRPQGVTDIGAVERP